MALAEQDARRALERLYAALTGRLGDTERLDAYYRGKQPLAYASKQWRDFHAARYREFSDNWCGVVANSPSERLRVAGFRLPSRDNDPSVMGEAEQQLWRWWQVNDLDEQSSQGFLSSIVSKRSFALVWGDDDGDPIVTWEHPAQMIVGYDSESHRRRTAALKVWRQDDLECATLYTPDQVWKYQRPALDVTVNDQGMTAAGLYVDGTLGNALSGGWVPRQPPEDDTWPIANPMGVVPVVEFPNRPTLGGEPLSDIAGTVAMQDAINLLWAYLFAAADHASFPARVIMGQEPPSVPILDSNGQKVGEKPVKMEDLANGRFLWLTGQNTSIGSWQPANLGVFTEVVETAVGHIAAQTRTPPHYLASKQGMHNLSADALKAAETGLVKKVEEQQLFLGPSVREMFRLMALAADSPGLATAAATGVTQWRDAETRSEAQLVDALQKLQAIGFPFEWIASRYGLSDPEIARLVEMRQQEADTNLLGTLAAQMQAPEPPVPPAPPSA
ncbi:MAG: phage portal protein [Blastococcus sp.]